MTPALPNRITLALLIAALLPAPAPAPAAAQVVSLRTVPIPAGEQFLVAPSRALGMGGAGVALDDPWQDPFVNPAKGARNERLRFFALPTAYGADGTGGGGATFPVAFLARHGRLFGGGGLAVQSPDDPNVNYYGNYSYWAAHFPPGPGGAPPPKPADLGAPANRYGYGTVGWILGDGRTSVGVGVGGSRLQQMDGVERLYPNRVWIQEGGHTLDLRAGVLRELPGGASVEALLLASRIDMHYDVGRTQSTWANLPTPPGYIVTTRSWIDHNRDVSRTYGLHLRYVGARDTAGVRVGYIATVNKKDYPVLPNYDIAPVPRDPGDSWAFQAGIGMSKERGKGTSALELVLEPAWSHTWATSPAHPDASGAVMVPEAVTSENFFHFYNAHAVAGFERRTDWGSYQYGLRIDEIHYSLSRQDFQTGGNIDSNDGWLEWTPTWGLAVHAGPVDLRYAGHLTSKGFPFDFGESKTVVTPSNFPGTGVDVLPPAVGSSTREFWTAAHQITISVPVGGKR